MLLEGEEPDVPRYYVVNRNLDDVDLVLIPLRLTPASAVLVEHNHWPDYHRAQSLSDVVIMASPGREIGKAAIDLVERFGRPILVLGECAFVDAVYADGKRSSLAADA